MEYRAKEIEARWQKVWEEEGVFRAKEEGKKVYVLEMFPYPSGRIHMGHVRNYTIGDAIARFLRFRGYTVLHPMGWDAFGLPAENAAIKHGVHPASWTYENIAYMKKQLKSLGFSYDWSREIATCSPEYYRWNQWLFLKFYEHGLAYRKSAEVNWCPNDETVLANEQVIDGRCWRCGTPIVRREVPSWYLKITAYAERLLEDLKELEGKWPERVIVQQRNWIGKSEGAVIKFFVEDIPIEVFTTRADTVFGATFVVLAPEHPLTLELAKRGGNYQKVEEFVSRMRQKSTRERGIEEEKEGVPLGVYATNPATGEKIPVWTANYVLYEYGTGAIMAVPAHDQRDYEFAVKYGLPIKVVVMPKEGHLPEGRAYEELGVLVNSGDFSGMESQEAKRAITQWLKEKGLGDFRITYRLRDWNISRQRYWGTPIPVVYCDHCGIVPVPEDQLPVLLPEKVEITGHGNPLEKVPEFVHTTCPKCGRPARRETDTMDTFFDSSWYFLRFCDPHNSEKPFAPERVEFWMPVDLYIGGIEHAVLHLLYARFFQKFLYDLGLVKDKEPFLRLVTQGMVLKRWVSVERYLKYLEEKYGVQGLEEKSVEELRELIERDMGRYSMSKKGCEKLLDGLKEGMSGKCEELANLYEFLKESIGNNNLQLGKSCCFEDKKDLFERVVDCIACNIGKCSICKCFDIDGGDIIEEIKSWLREEIEKCYNKDTYNKDTTETDKIQKKKKKKKKDNIKCYGVYIVYCCCSQNSSNQIDDCEKEKCKKKVVLYIGKGGTIKGCAYAEQDVIERLMNTKQENMSAKDWFECLNSICRSICCKHAEGRHKICVEIICLDLKNATNDNGKPSSLAPALIESLLIQAYYLENGHLPIINREF